MKARMELVVGASAARQRLTSRLECRQRAHSLLSCQTCTGFHQHQFLLGKPPFKKSAVFFNIVQKAFDPPPFYLNICPILQGVFFDMI